MSVLSCASKVFLRTRVFQFSSINAKKKTSRFQFDLAPSILVMTEALAREIEANNASIKGKDESTSINTCVQILVVYSRRCMFDLK